MGKAAEEHPSPLSLNDELLRRIVALEAKVEQLAAVVYVLNARLAEVESRLELPQASTPGWIPVKIAAFRVGCSPQNIYKLIRAGKIRAEKIGGHVLIEPDSLPQPRGGKV